MRRRTQRKKRRLEPKKRLLLKEHLRKNNYKIKAVNLTAFFKRLVTRPSEERKYPTDNKSNDKGHGATE